MSVTTLESIPRSLFDQIRGLRSFNRRLKKNGELDEWFIYGSGISDYEISFSDVLAGVDLVNFVSGRQNPVVVDFMSPSAAIATLFERLPPNPRFYSIVINKC